MAPREPEGPTVAELDRLAAALGTRSGLVSLPDARRARLLARLGLIAGIVSRRGGQGGGARDEVTAVLTPFGRDAARHRADGMSAGDAMDWATLAQTARQAR
jgi:hypothetical protein